MERLSGTLPLSFPPSSALLLLQRLALSLTTQMGTTAVTRSRGENLPMYAHSDIGTHGFSLTAHHRPSRYLAICTRMRWDWKDPDWDASFEHALK